MEVINQVLVIGVGVDGFNVTVVNAVLIVDDLQHRSDRVGGTGCCRDDLVIFGDVVSVDTVHDVFQVAFTWGSQNDLGDTLCLQVLAQAFLIAPYTRVIDHDGVVDAVLRVIDRGWIRCVDHLDLGAVSGNRVGFSVNFDGAVEWAVDGITTQHGSTFVDIVVALGADDNCAQPQFRATTGIVQQNTG